MSTNTEMFFVVIVGLCIGSFLNVVIWRVPRRENIMRPARSYCPECDRQLSWWENIPIASWAFLLARCSACKNPISGRYPLVEALTAMAAIASYIKFGVSPTGFAVFALTSALIAITFIDLDHKIIPNVISYPGMIFGLVLGVISEMTGVFAWPITDGAMSSLVGFLIGGGSFWLIHEIYFRLRHEIGLGGGDVKLMAMLGAILGWQCLLVTITLGSTLGIIAGLLTMLVSRSGSGLKTEIPFGPWLAAGAMIYMFTRVPFFPDFSILVF